MATPPLRPSAARRPPRRRAGRWIKRGLLVAVALAAIGALVYAWLPKPVPVETATAQRGSLAVFVDEDGRTRVHDRYVVSSPIAGDLVRIELEPGAVVERGAPIARLAPPDPGLLDPRSRAEATAALTGALARQRQAVATITRAKIARDAAVRDADRARTLAAGGAIPGTDRERAELAEELATHDLDNADLARKVAAAEVERARAVLGQAGPPGEATYVVPAPAAGRVLRVIRDSAGPVAAGTPLVELGDPHAIEVVVDVLSSDAARIALGAPVTIEQWGGDAPLTGKVRVIEPSAFTRVSALGIEEQRVNVVIALDDVPATLGDGFRVEAHILIWRGDDVLIVPASALVRDHGRWAVYVAARGRAHLREVEVGHRGDTDVEITSGLTAGELVILHPGDRIDDGARVKPR